MNLVGKPKRHLKLTVGLCVPTLIDKEGSDNGMCLCGSAGERKRNAAKGVRENGKFFALGEPGDGVDQFGMVEIGAVSLQVGEETGEGAEFGVEGDEAGDGRGKVSVIPRCSSGLIAEKAKGGGIVGVIDVVLD